MGFPKGSSSWQTGLDGYKKTHQRANNELFVMFMGFLIIYYTGCEELPSHGAGDNPGGTCGVTCEVVCSSQFCGVLISLYIYTLFPFQCYILIGFLISMPFFYDFDRFYLFRCYFSRILIVFFQYIISMILLPFLISILYFYAFATFSHLDIIYMIYFSEKVAKCMI